MAFSFAVNMPDNSSYTVKKLLGSNTKLYKSDLAGQGIITTGLSLAPAKASGFNVCTSASAACIASCLYTSGYARVHPRQIQPARIAKTRFFKLHSTEFLNRLTVEIGAFERAAKRKGLKAAVRLNVLSDIQWEKVAPSLFEKFPSVQFYDYTKHHKRMMRYLAGDLPSNYQLTFSWAGNNETFCREVLNNGGNVAVPFHVKYFRGKYDPLPQTFMGYEVVDGDQTDLRFLDPQGGYIVGLRAKGDGKTDKTGFVVNPNSIMEEVS